MRPNSASTDTPCACAYSTTRRVVAMLPCQLLRRSVDHDRSKTERDRFLNQLERLRMIQMQAHRHGGLHFFQLNPELLGKLGQLQVIPLHLDLRDLHDDGRTRRFRRAQDRCDERRITRRECAHGITTAIGLFEHLLQRVKFDHAFMPHVPTIDAAHSIASPPRQLSTAAAPNLARCAVACHPTSARRSMHRRPPRCRRPRPRPSSSPRRATHRAAGR